MIAPSLRKIATEQAEEVLDHYSGWRVNRLVDYRENTVFEIESRDGTRAALRLHRPGYQSVNAIHSELAFMAHLSNQGVRVPSPVLSDQGSAVCHSRSGKTVSVLTWLDGQPFTDFHDRASHSISERRELYRLLGTELAMVHNHADDFELPASFSRWSWDMDGFFGSSPLWGRFWDHPSLSAGQRKLMLELRHALRRRVQTLQSRGFDFGLIHADALPENVLVHHGQVSLIDFDDCGFGFRMYELAVALWRVMSSANAALFAKALADGYRSQRTLVDWQWQELELFVLIRYLACLGWIMPRREVGDVAKRFEDYTAWLESEGFRWLQENG